MADDQLQIRPRANLAKRDLSAADLSGANLIEANMVRADLSGANMVRADLSGANLSGANMVGADLSGATLSGADLSGVDLSEADLSGADLSGVDLSGATLNVATLIEANLSGANLSEAHLIKTNLSVATLIEANLSGANLSEAHLIKTNLLGANLLGANLSAADLSGADLSRADLGGADLSVVDLSGANLSGADLGGANLSRVDLSGADLSEAKFGSTVLANVDLRDVVGLEEARHSGPSTVGVDTLYLSEGRISEVFLRGCGLPDYFVGMVPGLTVTAAIQHFSAFISYSHADDAFARTLYDHLFHRQKVPIWLDEHEIEAGDLIMKSVDRAIRRMDKVVLLCSEASLNSWWVREEIERWTDRERQLSRKEGEAISMVIPVDVDGYLWDCDHEYAATIKKAKVVDANGWQDNVELQADVGNQLDRALKLDRRSPLQMLQDNAGQSPIDDLG